MKNCPKWKSLKNKDGVLLYEGVTLYGKPYGNGKTFFENGNIYQEGEFGIKGLLRGKEYYPNGKIRFEGIYRICHGYGPNFPHEGKCYDKDGNLYFEGEIHSSFSGVGYPHVEKPVDYGSVSQENRPDILYFMWEDEEKLTKMINF